VLKQLNMKLEDITPSQYFILHGIRLHHHIGDFEGHAVITTDYIAILSYKHKVNERCSRDKFIEVTFSHEYGSCGSGYTYATWGDAYLKKVNSIKDIHLKPIWAVENMIVFFRNNNTARYDDARFSMHLVMAPEKKLMYHTGYGGDPYYPSGGSFFDESMFEKTERYTERMKVYILTGDSGLVKSYIGNMLSDNTGVYETDMYRELNGLLHTNVVVLGNKHGYTVDDIKARYRNVKEQIDFVIVNFTT
jgi:hypothetical protein